MLTAFEPGTRLKIISCGWEQSQLALRERILDDGRSEYDVDRRAVDVAVFNAQGDHAIKWWPLYPDLEPGDIVIFSLSPHTREPIEGEVLRRAAKYSNAPSPTVPDHPVFGEVGPRMVANIRGFHGLGVVRDASLRRGPLVEGTVGHVVLFPETLTPDSLNRRLSSAYPALKEEFGVLANPELSCTRRQDLQQTELSERATSEFFQLLTQEWRQLFAGADRDDTAFEVELRALDAVAKALRSNPAVTAEELGALSAPVRWVRGARSRRQSRAGDAALLRVSRQGEATLHPLDLGAQTLEPGIHPREWLAAAFDGASGILSKQPASLAVLVVRDFISEEVVSEELAGLRTGTALPDRWHRLLVRGEGDVPLEPVIRKGLLPLAPGESAVPCWIITMWPTGSPLSFPPAGNEGLDNFQCCVVAIAPTGQGSGEGGRLELDPYALMRIERSFTKVWVQQVSVFRDAARLAGFSSAEEFGESIRVLRDPESFPENGSQEGADPAVAAIAHVHRRLEGIDEALATLERRSPQLHQMARASGAGDKRADAWVKCVLQPFELVADALGQSRASLQLLSDRASQLLLLRTADRTRRLLTQSEHAALAIRIVGAVTVLLAAFALYTSTAAVPEPDAGVLFNPKREAAALTIVVLIVALGYGAAVSVLARKEPSRSFTDPAEQRRHVLGITAPWVVLGGIPSVLEITGLATLPGWLTIGAALIGLGVAGLIAARDMSIDAER